jgi:hypothetical protein
MLLTASEHFLPLLLSVAFSEALLGGVESFTV